MMQEEIVSRKTVRRRTVFSFTVFFVLIAAGLWGWKWLRKQPTDQGIKGGILKPVREVLNANEAIFSETFDSSRLAKTYPKSAVVKNVRVNGSIGLKSAVDTATWKLRVIKSAGDTLKITLEDIKQLPKTEVIFDFKCIEGWSQVTHWGGVKFSDFIKAYGLDSQSAMEYVGLSTPDNEYYVGIDMPSALHAQTLLCYEMNGEPLPVKQGYPLRLIITVKYGVKSLKRIGTMSFSHEKPRDYWFERGYDYYLGH